MTIYATVCDGIRNELISKYLFDYDFMTCQSLINFHFNTFPSISECFDDSDENPLICEDSNVLEIILGVSFFVFILLFFVIAILSEKGNLKENLMSMLRTVSNEDCLELDSKLEDYQEAHEDKETINQWRMENGEWKHLPMPCEISV